MLTQNLEEPGAECVVEYVPPGAGPLDELDKGTAVAQLLLLPSKIPTFAPEGSGEKPGWLKPVHRGPIPIKSMVGEWKAGEALVIQDYNIFTG